MKKKKKKLVRYQGTKSSIVNRMRDAATTILSNVPKPKIQGTMGTTKVPMPLPKYEPMQKNKLSFPRPKIQGITGTTNIPMPLPPKKHGGSCGPTQWTRNGKGSRRSL